MSLKSGIAASDSPLVLRQLLRIGIVPYLNVQPLIWALDQPEAQRHPDLPAVEITPEQPRLLAQNLSSGQYHAAIVPVFEYLRNPVFTIVAGVSIASRGPVYSVVLFSDTPLDHLRTIYLDPASLTSVNLVRVLMAERGLKIEFVPSPVPPSGPATGPNQGVLPEGVGQVLIGDPAMARRGSHLYEYDLGELWLETTGLPFVFAAWLVTPEAGELPVASTLQTAARIGRAQLERVAAEAGPRFGFSPEEALRYFRENMCYDLGDEELAGWKEFARLSVKYGLTEKVPEFRLQER